MRATAARFVGVILATALVLVPLPTFAATSQEVRTDALTARLVSAQDGVPEGAKTISAALHLKLGKGWKVYWRSPGEVGIPPSIDWTGAENVANISFNWPAPHRFTAFGIENFGYEGEVAFPLQVELAEPGKAATLAGVVSLLVCSEVCVPSDFTLSLQLLPGGGIDQSAAKLIATWSDKIPMEAQAAGIRTSRVHIDDGRTSLTVALEHGGTFDQPDVFPELGDGNALGKPDIRANSNVIWAQFPILSVNEATLSAPAITVTDPSGLAATLTPEVVASAPAPPFALAGEKRSVMQMVGIAAVALLGGLVLNVMPCVLPVLSIKLSSAVKMQSRDVVSVRLGFLAAAAGVMVFMIGLAAILYGLQAVGVRVGWGVQFQSPIFLSIMVIILSLFTANLFGGFEISLPLGLQSGMANVGGRHGHGGDFLTGMFAAVMATPCSAPFLGTAVAFALSGRGVDIAVVFISMGLGLSLPYLLVAARPGIVTRLPKPGRWMIGIKAMMGVLLGVTALWLLWVLVGVAGPWPSATLAALSILLMLIVSWARLGARMRWSSAALVAVLALGAPALVPSVVSQAQPDVEKIAWITFARADIAQRVSRGEVVFVDVTADWCVTCKANKALVLEREPVLSALAEIGVTPMQADWTRPDEKILRYLERFNRFGIPFNAVYGPGAPEGIVLSEILSSQAVLNALERARENTPTARLLRLAD
jgi:suppressor for copper-sensitivity B